MSTADLACSLTHTNTRIMNHNVPIFCKVPIPIQIRNALNSMEQKDCCTDLFFVDADDTVDGYRSRVKSIPNYEGFFAVYEECLKMAETASRGMQTNKTEA